MFLPHFRRIYSPLWRLVLLVALSHAHIACNSKDESVYRRTQHGILAATADATLETVEGTYLTEINLGPLQCGPDAVPDIVSLVRTEADMLLAAKDRILERGELMVVVRDRAGSELARTIVADPRLRRQEVFEPDGTIKAADAGGNANAHLFIPLAEIGDVQQVKIYQTKLIDGQVMPDLLKVVVFDKETVLESLKKGNLKLANVAVAKLTTVRNSGRYNRKVDLVLIGDGYTQAEMPKWAEDARKVITGFFSEAPYNRRINDFNVHRIDIASAESGAGDTVSAPNKNTALGVRFTCNGVARLACANNDLVRFHVNSLLKPGEQDIVLVVTNSDRYGGSGGAIAVISMAPQAVDLALHETAHSFGDIADEYVNNDKFCAGTAKERARGNVTIFREAARVKWKAFFPPGQPVATSDSVPNGTVGIFEGADYCAKGVYRPTFNSKMRGSGMPFHAVIESLINQRIDKVIGANLGDDIILVEEAAKVQENRIKAEAEALAKAKAEAEAEAEKKAAEYRRAAIITGLEELAAAPSQCPAAER